jgi:hypothetical protein
MAVQPPKQDHLEIRVRLPGTRAPITVSLPEKHKQDTAKNVIHLLAKMYQIQSPEELHFVISPTQSNPGGLSS